MTITRRSRCCKPSTVWLSYEEWQHLCAGNPAYVGLHGQWPIGWVLQAGGDLVGYKGNIPVFYELNGKRLIAGCGYSWVVARFAAATVTWISQGSFNPPLIMAAIRTNSKRVPVPFA